MYHAMNRSEAFLPGGGGSAHLLLIAYIGAQNQHLRANVLQALKLSDFRADWVRCIMDFQPLFPFFTLGELRSSDQNKLSLCVLSQLFGNHQSNTTYTTGNQIRTFLPYWQRFWSGLYTQRLKDLYPTMTVSVSNNLVRCAGSHFRNHTRQ